MTVYYMTVYYMTIICMLYFLYCSDRRRHRIRWHSFVKSHRPSLNSRNLQISNMSAGQLLVMHKLSLLKVTAIMEKYSPTIRSGWNW